MTPTPDPSSLEHLFDIIVPGTRPATIERDLLARDPELRPLVEELETAVLRSEKRWDGAALAGALPRARRQSRRSRIAAPKPVLPALNPG